MSDEVVRDEKEANPLVFWVAYMPNGKKKNYLSDGKGHLRLYKTEEALRAYLVDALAPEACVRVVVHSIQGQIAIPEEPAKPPVLIEGSALRPVITTLAHPAPPSAQELLKNYIERKTKAMRRSGKRNS